MPTFVARTNLPTREPFRWSLNVARRELGVSSGTLSQRLSDANEPPGEDGCFSSRQLLSAVFGSLHKAKLHQVQEETRYTALRSQILRGEYLERAALQNAFGRVAERILEVIRNDRALSAEAREDLLRSLSSVPILISDVAAGPRRARDGSGDHAKESKPEGKKPGRKPKAVAN